MTMHKPKKAVLIIEDNVELGEILLIALGASGVAAHQCTSGQRALALAMDKDFDVFLTDYRMPGMNGEEVVRALRILCPRSLIIGMSLEERTKAFLDAGADAFLQKPFEIEQVLSLIYQ